MERYLLVPVSALIIAGCARAPEVEMPAREPFTRGPIRSVTHHSTASRYLVREQSAAGEDCGIAATADARTRYLSRVGGGAPRMLDRAALSEGDTVEVYVDGPVALSCPPQGHASAIILVAEGG